MKKNVTSRLQLIIIFIILVQNFTMACRCNRPYESIFCNNVDESHNVIRCVVTSFEGEFMTVDIIENIHNEFTENTIRVLGQDGVNCGESLSKFETQDTLILSLFIWPPNGHWYLNGLCGLHFLRYKDGLVEGRIRSSSTRRESLQEFKDNLFDCLMVSNEETLSRIDELSLFPNPISQYLQLTTDQNPISSLEIYNSSGQNIVYKAFHQPLGKTKVDTNDFGRGIYYIRVMTAKGIVIRKFLKI